MHQPCDGAPSGTHADAVDERKRDRWYALAVLMLVYTCHMLDRTVVNVVLEPIKAEFGLSDTQLGLLSGLAYGVVFSLAGIPMGLLIDRMNRRNLLAGVLVVWSGLTALAGFAQNYAALLAVRMGVAAAESGGAPAAMSMISDLFPPKQRSTAIGWLYASTGLGTFLSFLIGGIVAVHWGWRAVFFVAGIPGLMLAALVLGYLKEPLRGALDVAPSDLHATADDERAPGLLATLVYIGKSGALLPLLGSAVLLALVISAMAGWTVSFLIRVHGFALDEAGIVYALAGGGFGAAGVVAIGYLSDRMAKRDQRWPLRIVQCAALTAMTSGVALLYAQNLPTVIALLMICNFFLLSFTGPIFGRVLTLSPTRMRGTIMAILVVLSNLMGYGVGPFLTGVLSDFYAGELSLRPALASILLINVLVCGLLSIASPRVSGEGWSRMTRAN